jgi:hypothetical protein
MNAPIRWDFVSQAIAYYSGLGYRYVEVPWVVGSEAINVTLPSGRTAFSTMGGALVGSAEQSFIHMTLNGTLGEGDYVAATPCFRDDIVDQWHQKAFFKVELISLSPTPLDSSLVLSMARMAHGFFTRMPGGESAVIVCTPDGFDIELGDVELGSYGYREYRGLHWVYGTGLAEPRFSLATKEYPYSTR